MSKLHRPFEILRDHQASASRPGDNIWLSASAGTGKTHVLAARVYRLLLSGVKPESILCLTFTKAGAAEMAERINTTLAQWVRLSGPVLAKDLKALGEPCDPETLGKARKLFARVLDARGGGLRIQTIHSFCQTMLGAFPAEIGLTPGFRAMDAREQTTLARRVLGDLVIAAEAEGRLGLLADLRTTVLRLGEDKARTFLAACAQAKDALDALGPGMSAKIRRALGLPLSDTAPFIVTQCTDGQYPRAALTSLRDLNAAWNTARAAPRVDKINHWLSLPAQARAQALADLATIWTKADGTIVSASGWVPKDDNYASLSDTLFAHFNGLIELKRLDNLASDVTAALSVGQAYARAYDDAKRAEGLVDFDDLIAKTVALLAQPGIGQWIKYKLDQSTDHVLIDEAQDTNADQWRIVDALTDEFFAGDGAKTVMRTVFTVGDYKQAIFGFQGTNPKEFAAAKTRLMARARDAERDISDLSLSASFRSSQPILDVVDAVIDHLGAEMFGLSRPDPRHVSAMGGRGTVTLWPPIVPGNDDAGDTDDSGSGEEITQSDRMFATKLARTINEWLANPPMVECKGRPLKPEDIMILLRSRGDMARLIVAQLHSEGVPVAGLDRLRLNAPLAVRDLLACIRFVLQPGDDLNLATLLVSPIIGWDQQQLYDCAFGRKTSLWDQIRETAPPALPIMLKIADQITPYRFLEVILSGEIDARRKMIARMGSEIRDPVEELLNAALSFESEATASLQQFLDWFDRGDVDVARNLSEPDNAVRVMTVHGAKGLQAPFVILADATRSPSGNKSAVIDWPIHNDFTQQITVPIFRPRKQELVGELKKIVDASDAKEREEHWRLLYVAMTRAEERLYVGGALSNVLAKRGEVSPDSWHHVVARALETLGAKTADDATLNYSNGTPSHRTHSDRAKSHVPDPTPLPAWLSLPAPQEARPPRPLAPSSLGKDDTVQSPPAAAMRLAAERGRWLHSLFERLPDVARPDRPAMGARWLQHSAGVEDAAVRDGLIKDALAIINDPEFSAIFDTEALTEAPIAGVVAGLVIAGTVDRLIVTDRAVTVIDYKTGRRVPIEAAAAPRAHLRQMSAYVALLRGIFPNHTICAGLLYTSGPTLHMLDDALIEAHKPPYEDPN